MNIINFGKKAVLAAMILAVSLASTCMQSMEHENTHIPLSQRELADWYEIVILLRNATHTVENVRYAIYGANEIYTPLDKIAGDSAALRNLIECQISKGMDDTEVQITESIEHLKRSSHANLTGNTLVELFRQHRDTLKAYRKENEHRAVVSALLTRVIHDLSIIDVLWATE